MVTEVVKRKKKTVFSPDIFALSDDQLMLKLKSILDEQLDIEWTKEPDVIEKSLLNRVLRITGIRLRSITVTQKGNKDTYERGYSVLVSNPNNECVFRFQEYSETTFNFK